jgi:hypothetical protein
VRGWWNHSEACSVLGGMWRLMLPLLAVVCLGGGCGQMAQIQCSGGTPSGNTCIPDPGVHWTDAKATEGALAFDYAPMVKGKLTKARCRIVARLRYSEAESLCRAVFVAPNKTPRRVVVAFSLNGHGVLNPDCKHHWKTSPYCSARGQPIYSGS